MQSCVPIQKDASRKPIAAFETKCNSLVQCCRHNRILLPSDFGGTAVLRRCLLLHYHHQFLLATLPCHLLECLQFKDPFLACDFNFKKKNLEENSSD